MLYIKKKAFTFLRQVDSADCGIACLRMVFNYYGKFFMSTTIYEKAYISSQGLSMLGLKQIAMQFDMESIGVETKSIDGLKELNTYAPYIVHYNGNHFVVVLCVTGKRVKYADPAKGIINVKIVDFWDKISLNGGASCLLLRPTSNFQYLHSDRKADAFQLNYFYRILKKNCFFLCFVFLGILINLGYVYIS